MSSDEVKYVWFNGSFVPYSEAKVPILTHALHYGTGVFEGIRAYPTDNNVCIFRLKEHVVRMLNSAKVYQFKTQYTEEELSGATVELLRKNQIKGSAYIRPIIFVGARPGGIELGYSGFPVWAAIVVFPFKAYFDKAELRVCVSQWRRISEQSLAPQVKACANYLNSAIAKFEAKANGYDEAILLDNTGSVSEGSGENIFIVRNGKLYTPPIASGILEGITRDSVFHIAKDLNIELTERGVARAELYTCDELFFTGTAAGVTPILEVDKRPVGNGEVGPVTKLIKEEYNKIVNGKSKKYAQWLTPIY
ncbi:MAG: branched-chain amino acid transaminase [Thaumarchaeota archaeon]|nr:branched-chain amino acid transaminase [Nitrososphaerota archaeon]